MEEDKKNIKAGKPWDIDSVHDTFLLAGRRQELLNEEWSEKNIEGMQTKINRRSSTGKFAVKVRLHPDFEPKKPKKKLKIKKDKKSGKSRKRNKKNSD
jgi:hypothetical protein